MFLTQDVSTKIVNVSMGYLGHTFIWETFNCVHFVRKVYQESGISFPTLIKMRLPPADFHLSKEEFAEMPIGHSVFFKRRESQSVRYWTHVAIIIGKDSLIHCTRNLGIGVVVSSKAEFQEVYSLSPKY